MDFKYCHIEGEVLRPDDFKMAYGLYHHDKEFEKAERKISDLNNRLDDLQTNLLVISGKLDIMVQLMKEKN